VSEKKKVIQVIWNDNLLVSKGDEIEITRGIVYSENNVRASHLRNLTNGREERSSIEGVLMTQMPTDIVQRARPKHATHSRNSKISYIDLINLFFRSERIRL
jgi:hypothetical protein